MGTKSRETIYGASVLAAAAAVVLSAPAASAEKLTLACTFESGSFCRERDVNQVFIDTDRPQIDLRVAQTMGTATPYNWLCENNMERKDSIRMVSVGSRISVAAIYTGHAVVVSFDRTTPRAKRISGPRNFRSSP
jgi:hypothetical protein